MRADIAGIERGAVAFGIEIEEYVAVYVLRLQHVGGDIAGLRLDFALAQYFILIQILHHQIESGVGFLKLLFRLQHFGRGGVYGNLAALLLCQRVELFVGHVAPFIVNGTEFRFLRGRRECERGRQQHDRQ